MEVFTLIARKKNVALVFVSYLLVALAAISLLTICIGFAPGILFAVVFGLIAYSIQILLDIFLLSIIGLIMSKIAAVKLKYKEIFKYFIENKQMVLNIYNCEAQNYHF